MRIDGAKWVGISVIIGSSIALAGPGPTTQPTLDAQASSAEFFSPINPGASEPLQPVAYPAYSPDQDTGFSSTTQPAPALSEGMFVSHRTGLFSRTAEGDAWQITLDKDPADTGTLTISLEVLPNQQLSAMEDAARKQPDGQSKFVVKGRVTNYKMQQYLLVENAETPNADAAVLASDMAPAATQPAGPQTPDQVLNQMLKPAAGTGPRPLASPTTGPVADRTSGAAAVAPGAAILTVLREGTFLVDRTGRLTRSGDGQSWEFAFDADGRAMKDPPVLILPNLKLMSMEQAVKASSRDLRFRITGIVTEYNGRNYVLLEKVVVVPESGQHL